MRFWLVAALAAAAAACGDAASSNTAPGGSGGGLVAQGGSGGSGVAPGGSGGTDVPVLHPADRFDRECHDPSIPVGAAQAVPLPVQFSFGLDGMGLTCAGYVLESNGLGGASLTVFARTLPGVTWTAAMGTDPRYTLPLHCDAGSTGQACLADVPANGQWRTILIRLAKDGVCQGSLRQDVKVETDGNAVGSHQAMDPTDCP